MRRVLLAFALSLVAAAAAAGGAGAIGSGRWVCGPRSSIQLPGGLMGRVPVSYSKGLRVVAPPPPQPFYRVSLATSRSCALEPGMGTAFFIPAAGEVRIDIGSPDGIAEGNAVWIKLSRKVAGRLRKVVRKVKPYGAPKRLRQVVINDVSAARPSSYLRLYTIGASTRTARGAAGWIPILFFGGASPWTDGKNSISISRRGGYLKRDGQLVRISASLAARIRRAKPIP